MHDPDVVTELDGIHDPKRIATVWQCDFEDPRAEAFHRLGDVGLAALGGNRQRREANGLRLVGERGELLARGADPAYGPSWSCHLQGLDEVVKTDNGCQA